MRKTISLMTMILLLSFSAKTNAQKIGIAEIRAFFFPLGYEIHDFTPLNDTLYFAGQKITEPNNKKGIIAYLSTKDFQNQNIEKAVITEIITTKNLFKIKAYTNNNKETIIASIGEQRYKEIYYITYPGNEIKDIEIRGPELPITEGESVIEPQITGENRQTTTNHNNIEEGWVADKEETFGCLLLMNLQRTSEKENTQYELFHLPYPEEKEQIQDLYLDKDYITIISQHKETSAKPAYITIIEHYIDKNDYNNRISKQITEEGVEVNFFNMKKCAFLFGNTQPQTIIKQ